MLKKTMAFVGLTLSLSANAVVVTFDNIDYDITTVTGTYASQAAILEIQPWFPGGGGAPSGNLAILLGDSLGLPNPTGTGVGDLQNALGPLFVNSTGFDSEMNPTFYGVADFQGLGVIAGVEDLQNGSIWTFAVANLAVPIPATFWLFSSAIIGLIGIKRKK